MTKTELIIAIICFNAVVIFPLSAQQSLSDSARGEEMLRYVKGIEGKKGMERNSYVVRQLDTMGALPVEAKFDTVIGRKAFQGKNVLVKFGKGKQKIVIGAHVDAVFAAPGANDNGSGVAVLLEIARTLQSLYLHHTVECCFFDQEEPGLVGSSVYVRTRDTSYVHLAMINLDVEGTGEEIYAGPVPSGSDTLLIHACHIVRDDLHCRYYEDANYPESDYESFADAGLRSISISVVPLGDGKKLAKWVIEAYGSQENPADYPQVLRVMHTKDDRSEYVTADALDLSYRFAMGVLKILDDSH
jgi:Zn-dependent M28 family amino/carboxypeptidase